MIQHRRVNRLFDVDLISVIKDSDLEYMNPFCYMSCLQKAISGRLECNCGETYNVFDWNWADENSLTDKRLYNNMREVIFHPYYSTGTAAVRGELSLKANAHYYWEIKVLTKLYGTDVMVGFVNSKVVFDDSRYKYCNFLGLDSNSWGYSYHGYVQYNQLKAKYGSKYGLGTLIGVHLDMYRGTVEYYINRKPLGIAFRGLKNMEIYPVVSSTAARSAVRLVSSIATKETLQMLCLQVISEHPQLRSQFRAIPAFTRIYDQKYFWINTNSDIEKKDSSAIRK